jgi:hypothetical protein
MKSAVCAHDPSAKQAHVYFVRRAADRSEVYFGDPEAGSRFVMRLADGVAAARIADTLNGNRHRRVAAVGSLTADAAHPSDKPSPARTPSGKFLILKHFIVKNCF